MGLVVFTAVVPALIIGVELLARWRAQVRAREAALVASKRATMRRDLHAFLVRERHAAG